MELQNPVKQIKDSAKHIPKLLNHRPYILILLILLLILPPLSTRSNAESRLYYARIDIKYSDNKIEKSNFIMVPVENDFRAENFTSVFIKGTANFSYSIPGISIETQAEHNAIKRLLKQRGLKSIKSKSTSSNKLQHNEIVMSYEGVVKLPLKMINKKIDKQKNTCTISIEIEFAPIAFPDRWSMLKFKYKIKQILNHFILLFK